MKKTSILLIGAFAAGSLSAQIIADFTTDTAAMGGGFGTGWFSGATFDNDVDYGWDAGDYDWQIGQVNTALTTGFTSAGVNDSDFVNQAGTFFNTVNGMNFSRSGNPAELTFSGSDLSVFAITWDVLASPVTAQVTADFAANAGGGESNYQVYLNDTDISGPIALSVGATQEVSSSFTLSQGDTIYFVLDSAGSAAGDRRRMNFSVAAVPEPSSYALLAGALALGLVIVRRRG